MRSAVVCTALFAAAALTASAGAQMVVHAVSGTVKSVDGSGVKLALNPDTTDQFKLPPDPAPALEFDAALRSGTVTPSKFAHPGDFAVVYFYGFDSDQTAVAVEDLGPGPFQKLSGTVTGYDKHARTLTLKDSAGQTHTLHLSDKLAVDEDESVAEGRHFSPHKGESLMVAASPANEAVFIRDHD